MPSLLYQSNCLIRLNFYENEYSSEEWREEILANIDELDWSYLDGSAADALLRWIYTDIIDLNQQDSLSMNLLKAAHKFRLNSLLGMYGDEKRNNGHFD